LCAALLARGHRVRAAVREASRSKAPAGVEVAIVDPFDSTALTASLAGSDVLVHLIGTPHPNPSKAPSSRRSTSRRRSPPSKRSRRRDFRTSSTSAWRIPRP